MDFDVLTLILVLSLILCTQVLALFVQYRTNKSYKGIGYWLVGSSLMALGFITMSLIKLGTFQGLARIANPIIVLGHIFLYTGIKKFMGRKSNKWVKISIFTGFTLVYYYYMFIDNNMLARTLVISLVLAVISFMIAYELILKREKLLVDTANFTGAIFSIYGCFYMVRILMIIILPPTHDYLSQSSIIILAAIMSIILSNLWTLGLIIMVNQKLNIENKLEKEKLQLVFNTSIDAQLITRLEDGFIVDVNDEFSRLSGYSKDEVIGHFMREIWYDVNDRNVFTTELNDKGSCENMEFIFKRKDDSKFTGMISAKIIEIHSVTHIVSVIRDITERKLIELERIKLIEQLEIEKNTAQLNAITDSLTGLYNRGYFDKTLRMEFSRLNRSGSFLSLIMLDIDHFKKYNDTYGHLAGDRCIQMITSTLKNIVERAPDIPARYGGEEFIALLPETDEEGARILGEKIRKEVEDLKIPHETSETSKYVTVSIGVVTVYPAELASPDQALKLVDDALYQAKGKGRNRLVFLEQET